MRLMLDIVCVLMLAIAVIGCGPTDEECNTCVRDCTSFCAGAVGEGSDCLHDCASACEAACEDQ